MKKTAVALLLIVPGLLLLAVLVWASRARKPNSATMTSAAAFQQTVVNTTTPVTAPQNMVWIPGGEFSMGANDPPDMDEVGMKATEDARPIHRVYVDGF